MRQIQSHAEQTEMVSLWRGIGWGYRDVRDSTGRIARKWFISAFFDDPNRPRFTEPQWAQRKANTERSVNEALAHGRDTESIHHMFGPFWTPQREREQRDFLHQVWRDKHGDELPNERQMMLMAGLSGSGKGTVLNELGKTQGHGGPFDASRYLGIDADDMKERMVDYGMVPQIPGLSPMEMAPLIHEESSHLANSLARKAYSRGTNVLWDTTLGSPNAVGKRLGDMQQHGYTGHGLYVHTAAPTAQQRSEGRFRRGVEEYELEGKGRGGRYVPQAAYAEQLTKGTQGPPQNFTNFQTIRPHLQTSQVWDNNSDDLPKQVG